MLNVKKVASLIATGRGRFHDGYGLNLIVHGPKNANWQLRYQIAGRERWLGLGPTHLVGIGEARARARKARLQLLDGLDPIEEKRKTRAATALSSARAMSFARSASEYLASHSDKWRSPKSRRFFEFNMKTYANPVLGELSVAGIDTTLVMKVIEPLWWTKTVTASRLRGQIEAVLDWARVRGYRTGDNPAKWRGHLDKLLPSKSAKKVEHLAALPYSDMAAFITDLRTKDGIAARALEFTILTAARTGEVIGARWCEIDLGAGVWTVPASRMKGGREHRVPLSKRALELLRGLPRDGAGDWVFIGTKAGRGLSPMAMANLLRRMNMGITTHGFRSTFRDWCAEVSSCPNHVVEMALAHKIGNAVEAAYRRGDLIEKRARLMADWAAFCDCVRPSTAAVVPIRAGAS